MSDSDSTDAACRVAPSLRLPSPPLSNAAQEALARLLPACGHHRLAAYAARRRIAPPACVLTQQLSASAAGRPRLRILMSETSSRRHACSSQPRTSCAADAATAPGECRHPAAGTAAPSFEPRSSTHWRATAIMCSCSVERTHRCMPSTRSLGFVPGLRVAYVAKRPADAVHKSCSGAPVKTGEE